MPSGRGDQAEEKRLRDWRERPGGGADKTKAEDFPRPHERSDERLQARTYFLANALNFGVRYSALLSKLASCM